MSNCTKAVSSISISKNLKQFEKPNEFAKYEADSPYKEKKGLPGQLGYPRFLSGRSQPPFRRLGGLSAVQCSRTPFLRSFHLLRNG